MPTPKRDEVRIGVRRALDGLDERELAGCLLSLDAGLAALPDGALASDRWRQPDRVWQRLRTGDPALATLPLGRSAERAVKRAVAAGADDGRALADRALAAFLAELALDLLRRSQSWQAFDSPYRYRLPEQRHALVPVAEELAWRRGLDEEAARLAAALRLHLDAAADEAGFGAAARRLGDGFAAVVDRRPRQTAGAPAPATDLFATAGDGGTRRPAGRRRLHLCFGDAGNVALRLHPPRRFGGGDADGTAGEPLTLPPLARDLLHLGATVYLADQVIPRQRPNLGRRLRLHVGVRRPRLWNRLAAYLAETASLLAYDDVQLSFHPDPATVSEPAVEEPPPPDPRRAVLLFSGGLDSLAGAADLLAGDGVERLLLLSHYADTRLSGVQKALARELGALHGERVVHLPLFAGRSRSPERGLRLSPRPFNPLVQYLRSFLFLSAAAAVAVATGSGRIFVCENGPLALGPTFSEGHVPTRTAHPRLLARFAALLGELFGERASTVENPFLYLTKGEVVARLAAAGAAQLAARTDSCWTAGAVARTHGGVAHDGTCLPCFIRRAALTAADVAEKVPRTPRQTPPNRVPGYVRDVLTDFADASAEHQLLIADHLRFASTVSALAADGRRGELLDYASDLSLDLPGVEPQRLAATWARHADELFAFVEGGEGGLRAAFGGAAG